MSDDTVKVTDKRRHNLDGTPRTPDKDSNEPAEVESAAGTGEDLEADNSPNGRIYNTGVRAQRLFDTAADNVRNGRSRLSEKFRQKPVLGGAAGAAATLLLVVAGAVGVSSLRSEEKREPYTPPPEPVLKNTPVLPKEAPDGAKRDVSDGRTRGVIFSDPDHSSEVVVDQESANTVFSDWIPDNSLFDNNLTVRGGKQNEILFAVPKFGTKRIQVMAGEEGASGRTRLLIHPSLLNNTEVTADIVKSNVGSSANRMEEDVVLKFFDKDDYSLKGEIILSGHARRLLPGYKNVDEIGLVDNEGNIVSSINIRNRSKEMQWRDVTDMLNHFKLYREVGLPPEAETIEHIARSSLHRMSQAIEEEKAAANPAKRVKRSHAEICGLPKGHCGHEEKLKTARQKADDGNLQKH